MRPDDIVEYLRKQPFRPFRLHLTNGASYEIRHPEMMKVFGSQAYVFFPRGDDPHDLALRYDGVALLHMNRVEVLDAPAGSTPGTGAA